MPVPEQVLGRVVRDEDVKPSVGEAGRERVKLPDDLPDLLGHRATGGPYPRGRGLGQLVQVLALGPVKPQRPGHRVEHLHARVDLAALLEPRVPGDTDPREQRHLLASKSGRTPPRPARHADIFWGQPCPAHLEETAELLPPPLEHRRALPGLVGDH